MCTGEAFSVKIFIGFTALWPTNLSFLASHHVPVTCLNRLNVQKNEGSKNQPGETQNLHYERCEQANFEEMLIPRPTVLD